jgi:hypothetical protein
MTFNDTSGGLGLVQSMEDHTGLGETGISGNTANLKKFVRWSNIWLQKVFTMILEAQDSWDIDDANRTDYPVATTLLVAGQRDYTFPGSLKILKIKRADITYDGTHYEQMRLKDSLDVDGGLGNTTDDDNRFSKSAPVYDPKANSVWIYPAATAADVTAGAKLRIEFFREPQEFTTASTTTEPGFDEPFHEMIALGASFNYASTYNLQNKQDLWAQLQDYERRLNEYYSRKVIANNVLRTKYRSPR